MAKRTQRRAVTLNSMSSQQYTKLRLILGDQLNASHSWYRQKHEDTVYLIAELRQETDYVKHHVQKVSAFFAAMENFAAALNSAGHHVIHLTLDDTCHYETLCDLIAYYCTQFSVDVFEYQRPDEYRVLEQLRAFSSQQIYQCNEYDTEHFMLPFDEIESMFVKGKHHTMEYFYRSMRKRYNLLMDQNKPIGGKWNFDSENRQSFKDNDLNEIPTPVCFENSVEAILVRLQHHQVRTFGQSQTQLLWPVNRQQALTLLSFFCEHLLPRFGQYQDAMTCQSQHAWSLYHSRLSFALNVKMLSPIQVVQAAIKAYETFPDKISLPQVEGFTRQIVGWREFIRAIYWRNMPEYEQFNALNAQQALPQYFWHGKTKMRCMNEVITQSLDYAYAHHIQRLMITGNFCLLAGIEPSQVDEWYLGIYIDALQWVELPNTRGMSQHADHGIIATKPYAGSANYINKMSDYCKHCYYDKKLKYGEKACPFNSLYWHFLHRHQNAFSQNQRMSMIYRNWNNQADDEKNKVLEQAQRYLDNLESL